MTFPSVDAGAVKSVRTGNGTTHNVVLPTTIAAGKLIRIISGINGVPDLTPPTDFTTKVDEVSDNDSKLGVFVKIAVGDEGGTTVSFTTSVSEQSSSLAEIVSGFTGTLADIEISTPVLATSDSPNPGAVTPPWGSDDTLFTAIQANRGSQINTSGFPTNYSLNQETQVIAGTFSGAGYGVANRQSTATTENPDAFTLTASAPNVAIVMAFKPATAGPSAPAITTIDPDPVATGGEITADGTDFTPDTGANGSTQEQGAVVVALSETSRSATELVADTAVIEDTQLEYGTQTLRITSDAGSGTKTFIENPATGRSYVKLTSINTTSSYRITAVGDLAIGDQIAGEAFAYQSGSPTAYGVTYNADATFSINGAAPDGDYVLKTIRAFDDTDKTWGTAADQDVTLGTPGGGDGIPAEDGTVAPDHFNNSLPYNSASELAIDSTSAIDIISNGIPYTANGRICASLNDSVDRIDTGTPFDANDRVAMANAVTDYVDSGVPFTADGQIAVEL